MERKKDKLPIKYDDLKKLPLMSKCITEVLRLWPPIPNGTYRVLENDTYITGLNNKKILIEKGTFIQIPIWSRHHNRDLWGNDAHIFNPYREFKDDENYNGNILEPYNPNSERYSPFSYGPRDCIGKNFSQIEIRIELLYLLKNFKFTLSENQSNIKNINDLVYNDFTMGPRNLNNKSLANNKLGLYVNIEYLT